MAICGTPKPTDQKILTARKIVIQVGGYLTYRCLPVGAAWWPKLSTIGKPNTLSAMILKTPVILKGPQSSPGGRSCCMRQHNCRTGNRNHPVHRFDLCGNAINVIKGVNRFILHNMNPCLFCKIRQFPLCVTILQADKSTILKILDCRPSTQSGFKRTVLFNL